MFTVWYYLDYLLSKNVRELILALCLKIMIVAEAYSVLSIGPWGSFVFITSLTQLYRRWEALFSLVSLALRLLLLHVMTNDTDDSGEFIYMPNP